MFMQNSNLYNRIYSNFRIREISFDKPIWKKTYKYNSCSSKCPLSINSKTIKK